MDNKNNGAETLSGEAISIEESAAQLGKVLELDGPVSREVITGALNDSNYLHNLVVSRDTPEFLSYLLKTPPRIEESENMLNNGHEHSNMELLAKATKAIWKWSKSGFSTVDDKTFQHRFNTCLSCEYIEDPPNKVLYKFTNLTKSKKDEKKACSLCGCVVSRKTKLPDEACPAPHPTEKGMNRWGEPMSEKELELYHHKHGGKQNIATKS